MSAAIATGSPPSSRWLPRKWPDPRNPAFSSKAGFLAADDRLRFRLSAKRGETASDIVDVNGDSNRQLCWTQRETRLLTKKPGFFVPMTSNAVALCWRHVDVPRNRFPSRTGGPESGHRDAGERVSHVSAGGAGGAPGG